MHRALLLSLLLSGCAATTPCPSQPQPATTSNQHAPVSLPTLDEATLKRMSHAFFDALDRPDVPGFEALVSPAFVQFFLARTYDRAFVAKGMQARIDRRAPSRTRTWKEENTAFGPGVAVFMGEALERLPAEPNMPPGENDRWHTLVWVHLDGAWKVAHYQQQNGGIEAERQLWNDVFRSSSGFNHKPNQLLADSVRGRSPGTALDLAMGQGRNGVFLATQGWKVTGVDIAEEGLKRASEAAAAAKVPLDTVRADVDTWDLGSNRWDLVTMIYAGNDAKTIERLKVSLRSGGLVVIEQFFNDGGQSKSTDGFRAGEPANQFKDGWAILRNEVVEDISDWGLRKIKLVRFVAQKK